MKASVFIPSIPEHLANVPGILAAYQDGTAQPDEVVILISRAIDASSKEVAAIKNYPWNRVKTIIRNERVYAGPARQMALKECEGDIVIYQDSDDTPHAKRVQFVKHFFTVRDILLLSHSYFYRNQPTWDFTIDDIKSTEGSILYDLYFPDGKIESCRKYSDCYGGGVPHPVHAGASCIRREILEDVQWKSPDELTFSPDPKDKTEDYQFCMEVLYKWNKSLVIDCPLYFYS